MTRVVVVSGMSGAGKSSILRTLEDLGYEAVDNPPLHLLEELVARTEQPIAVGVDARTRGFDANSVLATLARLRLNPALRPELVYAWADEAALMRRFTETRRRHPLALLGRVADGIAAETELTRPLRQSADLVLDTTGLPLPALRRMIEDRFRGTEAGRPGMLVSLLSFAFPAGLPREADMVFDARFLRNPHYVPALRPGTGLDPAVAAYVEGDPDFAPFFDRTCALLDLVLPRFVQEGKKYATVAVGCTGGRHRSVLVAERLAAYLRLGEAGKGWHVAVAHREIAGELAGEPNGDAARGWSAAPATSTIPALSGQAPAGERDVRLPSGPARPEGTAPCLAPAFRQAQEA